MRLIGASAIAAVGIALFVVFCELFAVRILPQYLTESSDVVSGIAVIPILVGLFAGVFRWWPRDQSKNRASTTETFGVSSGPAASASGSQLLGQLFRVFGITSAMLGVFWLVFLVVAVPIYMLTFVSAFAGERRLLHWDGFYKLVLYAAQFGILYLSGRHFIRARVSMLPILVGTILAFALFNFLIPDLYQAIRSFPIPQS